MTIPKLNLSVKYQQKLNFKSSREGGTKSVFVSHRFFLIIIIFNHNYPLPSFQSLHSTLYIDPNSQLPYLHSTHKSHLFTLLLHS
ncbi:hypothetical protein QVD17_23049 [Tagetes erecta]|uniref:Uncharacterized protein n=1 Tax=Tagetes erecta TaxID=13708 RepID=A0AAD8KDL3_TARER|nr:hypothetical protein QVD17_23049 [Tagetes erecta]